MNNETISLTFGDQGENHVGMKKIGQMVNRGKGFNITDLLNYKNIFEEKGCECEIYNLKNLIPNISEDNVEPAHIMVIRNGIECILKTKEKTNYDLYKEMTSFEWDRKYYDTRRKKILNKNARANVCFGNISSEPDYEHKKGRVIGYEEVECLKHIKENLKMLLGSKAENLICEGNRYFDLNKCGIGWHGDAERRKVIALRLGEQMDLHYNWFYKFKPVGNTLKLSLNNGDIYIMSEKAVGTDWKYSSIYTLRHAAGKSDSKYLKLKY